MPIGLTASGEVVFPWDCRQIIEKQRGPVSVNVPSAPSDVSQKDQGTDKEPKPEQAAATTQPPAAQPQLAVATPTLQDTAATPVPRVRPKRTSVVVIPADKKHQIAVQPQPVSVVTRALNALK